MPRLTFYGLLSCFNLRRQPRHKACSTPIEATEATKSQAPLFAPSRPPSPPSAPLSLTPSSSASPPSPPPTPLPSPLPSPPPLPVQSSRFLWLPADIVLYFCKEHLPPAAAAALSLTCQAMFGLVFPTVAQRLDRNPSERQILQLLLEKDLGQHWWYCHGCSLLHPIRSRGPITDLPGGINYRRISWSPDGFYHNRHWLDGTSFVLDYEAVRLVMNRHFLGPPNGLPLDSFSVEAIPNILKPWRGRVLPWQERWSARIHQDELFLSATRTLSGAGWTDEDLRAALDHETRHVCGHVRITSPRLPFTVVNALRRPSGVSAAIFVQCRGVVESCDQCLTDYTTTVERRLEHGEQINEPWFITMTSYHQLGSGRSANDTKLHAFGRRSTKASYFTNRDMVAYPLGAVKAVWDLYKP